MFDIHTRRGPMYDPVSVQPMRDELTYVGFTELLTPEQVDAAMMRTDGTTLVMLNSVCGCAAGSARPGVTLSLQHATIPDRFVTVFAGMERDAVDRLRDFLGSYPPSSPFIALFKNGLPVFVMQRHQIEGRYPDDIAAELCAAFDTHCARTGPSIPKEQYDALVHAKMCGSKIPRLN